jgi:hypothetical protein
MITFVTSYLFPENYEHLHDEFYFENLIALCKENLNLVLFVYFEDKEWITQKIRETEDVTIPFIYPIQKKQLNIWNLIHDDMTLELPKSRNSEKDNREHLWKTHISIELVNLAINSNMYRTSHFAWISYSSRFLVKNDATFSYLTQMCTMNMKSGLLLPGCINERIKDVDDILEKICWRFTGGFFLGDHVTIQMFYKMYCRELADFLKIHRKLVWEVNFYAYLERYCDEWNCTWYPGNHNDSLITGISPSYFTNCLANIKTYSCLDYKNVFEIPGFYPTSSSYLKYYDSAVSKYRHYLNIRYVNYWLFPNGYYRYPNSEFIIDNKNVVCELDEALFPVVSTCRIMEEVSELPSFSNAYSHGLEDVRIYEIDGKIKCSATNLNHVDSGSGRSRIMVSDYCLETHSIKNGVIITPPGDTWCEKNWVHLVYEGKESFVYKWFPYQIGHIENDELKIVYEKSIQCPLFRNVRGSSLFVPISDTSSVGVVHFSEEGSPRKYYHMVVEMEENIPVRYSQPFCFRELSVEFCIGFTIHKENYVFWISQMDREPCMIMVHRREILCNNNVY